MDYTKLITLRSGVFVCDVFRQSAKNTVLRKMCELTT